MWWRISYPAVAGASEDSATIQDLVALRRMKWSQLLPGWDEIAALLDTLLSGFSDEWPVTTGNLETVWPVAFTCCESSDVSSELRRSCYEAAAEHGRVPNRINV